ncbi:Uncharacterised protein [Yersinia enterocolitica]|nr:Uncharacterised protein [Yersinia enterocolitica]
MQCIFQSDTCGSGLRCKFLLDILSINIAILTSLIFIVLQTEARSIFEKIDVGVSLIYIKNKFSETDTFLICRRLVNNQNGTE